MGNIMKKNKSENQKKITEKNFKDFLIDLLKDSDSKGITISSSKLLEGVEQKYENESDISIAFKVIKSVLKKYKGSIIEEEEATNEIEALVINELKKDKRTGLEAILWKCANILRTKEKSDNRKAVLGLVFLKFVGDKFNKRQNEIKQAALSKRDDPKLEEVVRELTQSIRNG
jgi:hypothetical protein